MATIVRDPQVGDYIVEREPSSEADLEEIRLLYEQGYLILLRGVTFDLDYEFLNGIDFDVPGSPDVLHKVKKLTGRKFLGLSPTGTGPVESFVFQNIFESDAGKLAYFQEQVKSGNAQSDALYAKLFPKYVSTRAVHTGASPKRCMRISIGTFSASPSPFTKFESLPTSRARLACGALAIASRSLPRVFTTRRTSHSSRVRTRMISSVL
jgi:hypothetical protein